jgi:hypothetical protein
MDNLLKFIDFLLENKGTTPILYSNKLTKMLEMVSSKITGTKFIDIANMLIKCQDQGKFDTYTLVDIVPNKNDTVSMSSVSRLKRVIDSIPDLKGNDVRTITRNSTRSNSDWSKRLWSEQRTEVKIGRYSKRIITSVLKQVVSDSDIENFVNIYKSTIDYHSGLKDKIMIVEGEDIRTYYNESMYKSGGGSLNNSCMRYPKCQKYLDIYVENPEVCKLMILLERANNGVEDKLIGRALLWETTTGKFMDRVYSINDSDVMVFKDYASEKGWVTYYGKINKLVVKLKSDFSCQHYPYMDTLYLYDNYTKELTNDDSLCEDNGIFQLQNVDGTYNCVDENMVYSEWCDRYIEREDAIYCSNVSDYLPGDEAVYLEYKDEYVAPVSNVIYSDYDEQSYWKEDCFWSKMMDCYVWKEQAVKVIVSVGNGIDYDYCGKKRHTLYKKVGDDYYSSNYIIDPYGSEYIFAGSETKEKICDEFSLGSDNIFAKKLLSEKILEFDISKIGTDLEVYYVQSRLYGGIFLSNLWTPQSVYVSIFNNYLRFLPEEKRDKYNRLDIFQKRGIINQYDGYFSNFDFTLFGSEIYKLYLYIFILGSD